MFGFQMDKAIDLSFLASLMNDILPLSYVNGKHIYGTLAWTTNVGPEAKPNTRWDFLCFLSVFLHFIFRRLVWGHNSAAQQEGEEFK